MRLTTLLPVLLALSGSLSAAPPTFDPPTSIPVEGGIAIYSPPADCVNVRYVGLDGREEFPLDRLGGSKTAFAFITQGLTPGKTYRFVGVASSATGELVEKKFSVTVPKDDDGGTLPPPVDPPTPSKGLYFAVIRADGPSNIAFDKIMEDPAWKKLKAAGHKYSDLTVSEAAKYGIQVPGGSTFPVVVTLRENANGKTSKVVLNNGKQAIPLPTTPDGILKLPDGVQP